MKAEELLTAVVASPEAAEDLMRVIDEGCGRIDEWVDMELFDDCEERAS